MASNHLYPGRKVVKRRACQRVWGHEGTYRAGAMGVPPAQYCLGTSLQRGSGGSSHGSRSGAEPNWLTPQPRRPAQPLLDQPPVPMSPIHMALHGLAMRRIH